MFVEVAALRKLPVAVRVRALERSITCQGTCLAETLVTHGTYIRAVARVCLNVTQYLLLLLELAAMLGTLAADPATFVFSLTRTDMHFGNMRSQLGMRIKTLCTMNPTTGMLLFALFIKGTQTGRHNIVEQTLRLQRDPRTGICRRRS